MTLPEGLTYVPGFVSEAESDNLLAVLATFELQPYVLHDTPSRRLNPGQVGLGPARRQSGSSRARNYRTSWHRDDGARCPSLYWS